MGRFLNRRNFVLFVVAVVTLPVIWLTSAGIRGRLMASWDIARGRYRIVQTGFPGLGFTEYRALLHERYGVEVEAKGCIVDAVRISYADAYNREMVAAANKKFGHDVFKECWNDAARKRAESLRAERQSSAQASEEVHPTSSR